MSSSQGVNQFNGKETGFLSKILRARPIPGFAGLMRLRQKALYFLHEIELRGAEPLIGGLLKIFFRDADVVISFVGVSGLIVC